MKYLFEEFRGILDVEELIFKNIKEVTDEEVLEIAKRYCTIFNEDNIKALDILKIRGKTSEKGIWKEDPYTLESSLEIIEDFKNGDYLGIAALGKFKNKFYVLGGLTIQKRDKERMLMKGYLPPFDTSQIKEYYCAIDTFRRDFTLNGQKISNFSGLMRKKVIEQGNFDFPILIYSSTNNQMMVEAWRKDGFEVIEKETTFGNKYQAFKKFNS